MPKVPELSCFPFYIQYMISSSSGLLMKLWTSKKILYHVEFLHWLVATFCYKVLEFQEPSCCFLHGSLSTFKSNGKHAMQPSVRIVRVWCAYFFSIFWWSVAAPLCFPSVDVQWCYADNNHICLINGCFLHLRFQVSDQVV